MTSGSNEEVYEDYTEEAEANEEAKKSGGAPQEAAWDKKR